MLYQIIANHCKSMLCCYEVVPDHTHLDLIISRHCRDCLSRILSVCISVLRGRRLFSPVSIQALVLHPSQGDFSAVGRRSHENSSLDSLSLCFSHTPIIFQIPLGNVLHTFFFFTARFCLSFFFLHFFLLLTSFP